MSYVKNIKEILNIPSGSRSGASNGPSSLTDSTLFFGSQATSQDISLSSRNSQQSSQEGSDPAILSRYTSKPLLFGDSKDKTRISSLLDKFEEDRKKAKEKNDSDQFVKESQHIRETLINIQQLVSGAEKNTTVCQGIFEKFDSFASAFKNSLESLRRDISQMFETLADRLSSQREVVTEVEEKVKKNGETTAELETQLKSLKNSLECLRKEQEIEQNMLAEALKLLNYLVPKPTDKPSQKVVIDSSIQTSPEQELSIHNILQNNQTEGVQLPDVPYDLQQHVKTSVQVYRDALVKRKRLLKSQRRKKRPLVLSQNRKRSVPDENLEPTNLGKKPPIISGPLRMHCSQVNLGDQQNLSSSGQTLAKRGNRSSVSPGCFITPLSCWSQDSNSSECLAAIESIQERQSDGSKIGTRVQHVDFWQLFESDFGY